MSSVFQFSNTISEKYRDDLEQLFFFNPQQERYYDQIVDMVETFGHPKIEAKKGEMRLIIARHPDVMNLFALHEGELAGVVLYALFSPETLSVLHIAIHPEYTVRGRYHYMHAMDAFLDALRHFARERHIVSKMTIGYAKGDRRILALPLA